MNNEKENKDLAKGHDKGELSDKNKGGNSDISNSLENDAVGDISKTPHTITPQNRTDNEQDEQKQQ